MQTACTAAAAALLIATAVVASGCRSVNETRSSSPPAATVAPAGEPSIVQARALFYRAVEGDAEALRQCESLLVSLPAQDAKVRGYRGACEMLRAKQARWPWEKGRHAEAGLRMLDAAVAEAPSDPEVRFVRGMTSYNLPAVFDRQKIAAADLSDVAGRAESIAADGMLDAPLAAASLYYYGEMRHRAGDETQAVELWRRAVKLAPMSRAATHSAERLHAASNRNMPRP